MLNTHKLKAPDKIIPSTPKPVAPFPIRDQSLSTDTSLTEIPLAKPPGPTCTKAVSSASIDAPD